MAARAKKRKLQTNRAMPHLRFYAAGSDLPAVLELILGAAGCSVFESYSIPGNPLRQFATPGEVVAAFDSSEGSALGLLLYAPSMRGRYRIRRFELKPASFPAAPWRETIEGWGLIQLELRGVRRGALGPCRTNHNSEARARKWESACPEFPPVAEWDFKEVTRISRRINGHIRNKLAVARVAGAPILPGAQAILQEGTVTLRAI